MYGQLLLIDGQGVEKVIRTLGYHHRRKPRRDTLKKELTCFRRNRSPMDYAYLRAQNLPDRLRHRRGCLQGARLSAHEAIRSPLDDRWGQAILTFRALVQSHRFDAAWTLVVADYRKEVSFPINVVPFPPRRTSV